MKIIIVFLFFISTVLGSSLKYENLMQGIPKGFKLGFKDFNKKTRFRLLEFIPKNETVNNWSQMITTSIYHRNINLTPIEYINKMDSMWKNSCKDSYTKFLSTGKENGYKYALLMAYCPINKMTNKEELTYFKAIKGNDSFYIVQKAFAYNPSEKEIINSMSYLKKVYVCDTRLNNCPKVTK